MNDALTDLRDRLKGATQTLDAMRNEQGRGIHNIRRLEAKREGVLLALSYVEEAIRQERA